MGPGRRAHAQIGRPVTRSIAAPRQQRARQSDVVRTIVTTRRHRRGHRRAPFYRTPWLTIRKKTWKRKLHPKILSYVLKDLCANLLGNPFTTMAIIRLGYGLKAVIEITEPVVSTKKKNSTGWVWSHFFQRLNRLFRIKKLIRPHQCILIG